MASSTLTFSLSPSCTAGSISVQYQECTNQDSCTCPAGGNYSNSVNETLPGPVMLTGLRTGVAYCYRSVVTNGGGMVAGTEESRMFTTLPPVPPSSLLSGAAVLVSSDPVVVYECVSSTQGFNGNNKQIEATFDTTTSTYSVPPCSCELTIHRSLLFNKTSQSRLGHVVTNKEGTLVYLRYVYTVQPRLSEHLMSQAHPVG